MASSSSSATAPPDRKIWALLIGIEHYPDHSDVPGALRDLENMRGYLRDRGVPDECIKVLQDDEARRQTILDLWHSHLIDNDEIVRDEPILIYFSGHGANDVAPDDWPIDGPNEQMEMLVAYDSLAPEGWVEPECAIPDRTIGGLLRKTAQRHSNNITLIFDCCHSAHMNRGGDIPAEHRFTHRGVSFDPNPMKSRRRLKKITSDVDRQIWDQPTAAAPAEQNISQHRGAFFTRQNDTHVFLAACTRKEESSSNPRGGLFTRALLASLAETEDISYDHLLTRIHEHFRLIRNEEIALQDAWGAKHNHEFTEAERPGMQTPQCEGTDRSRLIWRKGGDAAKSFTVQPYEPAPDGTHQCQIHAGVAAGVKIGTVFQLNEVAQGSNGNDTNLASVIATEVKAKWCIASLPAHVIISPESVRAVITTLGGPLKYWIDNTESASPVATDIEERVRQSMQKRRAQSSATFAGSADAADVVLHVSSQGVSVDRKDTLLRPLQLDMPLVKAADVNEYFPSAFPALARFHDFVSLENTARPFADLVDVRLHVLPPRLDEDELREAGEVIPFVNGEAKLASNGSGTMYAVCLTNHSDVPLFPFVMWFDPQSYSVQSFWSPLNGADAPLAARRWVEEEEDAGEGATPIEAKKRGYWDNGYLQLGRSTECHDAMWFELDPGQARDTGVLKIFLSERMMELNNMEQDKIFGYTPDGVPNIRASNGEAGTRGGEALTESWDTVTKLVTVVPNL